MAQEHNQQSQKPRRPAYIDWPTIKILTAPQGKFSPKTDEWCATFCRQSVAGRYHYKEPSCRSICIRKVFPHEVRNIVTYRQHKNVGPDGKAKYTLPTEGQPDNVPRLLGGSAPVLEDDEDDTPKARSDPKYWDEGWYLWTSSSTSASMDKLSSMRGDLATHQMLEQLKERRTRTWNEYQEYLERKGLSGRIDEERDSKWFGHIKPSKPSPDESHKSLLIPLPPEISVTQRFERLFAPTQLALDITRDTIQRGDMKLFAERVWEKAFTKEPFILASRAGTRIYEILRKGGGDDEDGNTPDS